MSDTDEKLKTQTEADDEFEAAVSDSDAESDNASEDQGGAGESESVTTKRSKTSRVTIKSPAESEWTMPDEELDIITEFNLNCLTDHTVWDLKFVLSSSVFHCH